MEAFTEIIDLLGRLPEDNAKAVLATVVETSGSTYRKAGARMLIYQDGRAVGVVSGGCVEGDLLDRARSVLETGRPELCVYDATAPGDAVWGLGLGCKGVVRVLVERADDPRVKEAAAFLSGCRDGRREGALATVFAVEGDAPAAVGDRLMLDDAGVSGSSVKDGALAAGMEAEARAVFHSGRSAKRSFEEDGWKADVLVEHAAPPIALFIYGGGPDALPLTTFGRELGWRITVADSRADFAKRGNFPHAHDVMLVHPSELPDKLRLDARSAAVVMSHRYMEDLEVLAFLLRTDAPYIGLLGPRARKEKLIEDLESRGGLPNGEAVARMYGPAGLDLGGESPEAVAVSIAAEIQCVVNGRKGGFLRDRTSPLHV
jgi:xanthine/CO dehydrogenase XdhC/CoxF family maturation factor